MKAKKKLIKNQELFQFSNNLSVKEFFRQFMKKREQTVITELVENYGLPRATPNEILKTTHEFYTNLYAKDSTTDMEQNEFLSNLKTKLPETHKQNLSADLCQAEIEAAISDMKKGKAPGPDGLSVEFYLASWLIIKDEIFRFFEFLFSNEKIHEEINVGFTTLIYKKGQKEELSNYRRIFLLNYDLKIFTKC